MGKLKFLLFGLAVIAIAAYFYATGALSPATGRNADPNIKRLPIHTMQPNSGSDRINLTSGLTGIKLPGIAGIKPKAGVAYKLIIGDSSFNIKNLSFIDASGNEKYSALNFDRNLAAINENSYGLKIGGISGPAVAEIYEWHKRSIDTAIQKKNISLVALDAKGYEKARYNFYQSWPSKFDSPDFNAKGNEVAIDTLVIECESVSREDDDGDD